MAIRSVDLPEVEFLNEDVETIISEMIREYENVYYETTGERKTLYPGDPQRIFIYSQALRELQLRIAINNALKQNLIKYSSDEKLENLGAFTNTERLKSRPANTIIKFTLSRSLDYTVEIPKGTRVSDDNGLHFKTLEKRIVEPGDLDTLIEVECVESGLVGNGLLPGQIKVLVDPLPWISGVENTTTTQGGADIETDDEFRDRILLAPESFSVAGPSGAYEFFTKSYSSAVSDVKVKKATPGTVDIIVLLDGGDLPQENFLNDLKEFLSDDKKRPLTDNIVTKAPTKVNYNIDLTYYISDSNLDSEYLIKEKVTKAIEDYVYWQGIKIGRDINPSELNRRIIEAGAKRVEIVQPSFVAIDEQSVASLVSNNSIYGGLEND